MLYIVTVKNDVGVRISNIYRITLNSNIYRITVNVELCVLQCASNAKSINQKAL